MPEQDITTTLAKILLDIADMRRDFSGELAETRQIFSGELGEIRRTFAGDLAEVRQDLAETREDLSETRRILAAEIIDTRQTLEGRIDGVEAKLDSFRNETLGHFDDVYRRFDRLESE